MIDAAKVKRGDCLGNIDEMGYGKMYFVICPFLKYRVCIRHEYELSENRIYINSYKDLSGSIEKHSIIPLDIFKDTTRLFYDAFFQAMNIIGVAEITDEYPRKGELIRIYKLSTGGYVVTPNLILDYYYTIEVSNFEFSRFEGEAPNWKLIGAEWKYVDFVTYQKLLNLFVVKHEELHRQFLRMAKICNV